MVTKVEEKSCSAGTEDAATAPAWAKDGGDELPGNHSDKAHSHDSEENPPPHPGCHFEGPVCEGSKTGSVEGMLTEAVSD